jgi:predicted TIM-barrel fold metal-dependent hydrolase
MEQPIDVNCRAVRVDDEYELVDCAQIAARIAERLAELQDEPPALRLLTPPVYYSLAKGIDDDRTINDALIAAAHRLGSRAFGTVEPRFGDAVAAEIQRLGALGAAGVVWSARAQGMFGNDHLLAEHIRQASRCGLVSMVQASSYSINEGLWRLWALAEQCDGAPLVVLGAFESWEAIQLARENRGGAANVFYEVSAMSEGYDLDHLFAAMGTERLLLGSGGGDGLAATLGVLGCSALPPDAREAILWRNAVQLFRLAETRR